MISCAPPRYRRPQRRASLIAPSLASAPLDARKTRQLRQPGRQRDCLVVEQARPRTQQPMRLPLQRLCDLRRTVPERIDRPALHEVEVTSTAMIDQPAASALDEHLRRPGGDVHQGVGLEAVDLHLGSFAGWGKSGRKKKRAAESAALALSVEGGPCCPGGRRVRSRRARTPAGDRSTSRTSERDRKHERTMHEPRARRQPPSRECAGRLSPRRHRPAR